MEPKIKVIKSWIFTQHKLQTHCSARVCVKNEHSIKVNSKARLLRLSSQWNTHTQSDLDLNTADLRQILMRRWLCSLDTSFVAWWWWHTQKSQTFASLLAHHMICSGRNKNIDYSTIWWWKVSTAPRCAPSFGLKQSSTSPQNLFLSSSRPSVSSAQSHDSFHPGEHEG